MISVCIPVYNGELFIEEQISSILYQLGDNEIVLSFNRSSDLSRNIVENFGDSRIVIVPDTSDIGLLGNLENALRGCRGDIIFLCDQDDVWKENKINVMSQALLGCDIVVSDCIVADQQLRIIERSLFARLNSGPGLFKNFIKNSYVGCCMAFRREMLSDILPFPRAIPMHDWWIGLIAEMRYRVMFIPDALMYYRRHNSSLSATGQVSSYSWWIRMSWRFRLVYFLILRMYF